MSKRIIFRPGNGQIGVIQGHNYSEIEVGPVDTDHGTVYRYKIGPYLSKHEYANPASARYDAIRPQRITLARQLVPDVITEADHATMHTHEGRLAGTALA